MTVLICLNYPNLSTYLRFVLKLFSLIMKSIMNIIFGSLNVHNM